MGSKPACLNLIFNWNCAPNNRIGYNLTLQLWEEGYPEITDPVILYLGLANQAIRNPRFAYEITKILRVIQKRTSKW